MAGPITQSVQNLLRRQQQRDQFETRFRFAEQKELSKRRLEATENARQEDLRLQVFQNNPELLGGPLRQPIPPAGFNRGRPFPPPGVIEETNVGPPLPRPGARQEIQARLQGIQKRQQENFKEFAIDNEENAKIFSQLPADVSAKLATELRTGRTDSFARIKEQAGSFGSVAQQALSMKAGPRRNDFLIKDFETRQRLAESEGVQGPDAQRYLDIINATGNPDLQDSLLKNIVGTTRNVEKLITSKETQDKEQSGRDDFALSGIFKSAPQMNPDQQEFLLREQRQAFIAEGNNEGVREIDRMLRVPAGPDRNLLMTSRAQQLEGKEVRKARIAPVTLSEGQRRVDPLTGKEIVRGAEKAPAGAASPPGKIGEDRRALVSAFGVNSLEVKRFDKIVRESAEEKDTGRFFILPNGQRISRSELSAAYRMANNILSPFEIIMLEISNPEAAAREKVRASKATSFAKWAKRERGVDIRGGFQPEEEIEASPVALPRNKEGVLNRNDLVIGGIYQSTKGPIKWNGKTFKTIGK